MIRRRQMREQGYVKERRRISVKGPTSKQDGFEVVQARTSPNPRRERSSTGRDSMQRHRSSGHGGQKMDIDAVDGAGELDEMDRALLGEVDADETEDDDQDDDVMNY